ncbi:MAG TPA: DUF488 domain-containing protein [Candidatus Elarobacter sp.]|nr:DUF488 domain-containing protein [Candidatus Elarobacter sp.]
MKLFTIGFTQTTAESFFARLLDAGVARVLDTRVHRDGQLAGFAKARDLEYFLRELAGAAYRAVPELAPTPELLARYRDRGIDWDTYAAQYAALLDERRPETTISAELLDGGCLLCSEPTPVHCHRRLAAEYLAAKHPGLEVVHL